MRVCMLTRNLTGGHFHVFQWFLLVSVTPSTGSRSRPISSHHIRHSSSCVCVSVWFHTWLPCCLLTMHVFISSMCVYVCVWCRKTITIRILDREEYNKQSSFYLLLDSPQWRRSRKEKTGVRASQHPESQINRPQKMIIRTAKSLSSKHPHKGIALYLFCTATSPISKTRRWWNETEQVREPLLCCQTNEHFTAGGRARKLQRSQNSSCFYIRSQVTECSAAPQPLLFLQACWYGTQHALESFCCSPLHLWCLFCTFLCRSLDRNPLCFPFLFSFLTWVYFSSDRTCLHPATHRCH